MKLDLNKVEIFFMTTLINFLLFGLYFAYTNLPFFEGVFVREDGLVEWITVMMLISGALLCFQRAKNLRHQQSKLFLTCTIILGCLFIFGAGEEISWGQRIFNISSPEFFQQHNSQQETNLHNLVVNQVKINKLIFGTLLGIFVALYLLFLPLLYQKNQKIQNFVSLMAIPVPRYMHTLCYVILFLLVQINPSPKRGELLEFGGCFLFFLITLYPLNKNLFDKKN